MIGAIGGRLSAIAFDRPGWDGRSAPRGLEGNADAAVTVLDRCGVERATIVGHSFGAAVAAWLAADDPDRVGALVLLAPAANRASLQWIDRWLAARVLGSLLSVAAVAGPGLVLSGHGARRLISSRLGLDVEYLSAAGRQLRQPVASRTFIVEQRAIVRSLEALEGRLASIGAPTTIVIGSADRIVPPSSAKLLAAQIPRALLVPVRGAGHLLAMRHAELVAEIVVAAAAATGR